MKDIILRPVTESDHKSIILLLDKNLSSYIPKNFEKIKYINNPNTHRYIILHKKTIISYGSLYIETNIRLGKLGHIEDIVVCSDYQGKGIGKMIIQHLLNVAKREGCYKVGLASNKDSENFYRAVGFEDESSYFSMLI